MFLNFNEDTDFITPKLRDASYDPKDTESKDTKRGVEEPKVNRKRKKHINIFLMEAEDDSEDISIDQTDSPDNESQYGNFDDEPEPTAGAPAVISNNVEDITNDDESFTTDDFDSDMNSEPTVEAPTGDTNTQVTPEVGNEDLSTQATPEPEDSGGTYNDNFSNNAPGSNSDDEQQQSVLATDDNEDLSTQATPAPEESVGDTTVSTSPEVDNEDLSTQATPEPESETPTENDILSFATDDFDSDIGGDDTANPAPETPTEDPNAQAAPADSTAGGGDAPTPPDLGGDPTATPAPKTPTETGDNPAPADPTAGTPDLDATPTSDTADPNAQAAPADSTAGGEDAPTPPDLGGDPTAGGDNNTSGEDGGLDLDSNDDDGGLDLGGDDNDSGMSSDDSSSDSSSSSSSSTDDDNETAIGIDATLERKRRSLFANFEELLSCTQELLDNVCNVINNNSVTAEQYNNKIVKALVAIRENAETVISIVKDILTERFADESYENLLIVYLQQRENLKLASKLFKLLNDNDNDAKSNTDK